MNLVKKWAQELGLSEDFIRGLARSLGSGIIKGVEGGQKSILGLNSRMNSSSSQFSDASRPEFSGVLRTVIVLAQGPWFRPEDIKILLPARGAGQHDFEGLLWGQKVLEASSHSIPSPRPTPRRKKCPGTNEGNPNCQNVLPRTTLSSAGQNHGRKKRHISRGHPLEDHKRDSKLYGLAIGE